MKRAALLIGNGLNRCYEQKNPGISWYALLQDFAKTNGVEFVPDNPFPLEFECLVNAICEKSKDSTEQKLFEVIISKAKSAIAEKVADLNPVPDSLHHRFMRLPISEILTTNYDYVLERAWSPNVEIRPDAEAKNNRNDKIPIETKYSLYRKASIDGKNFYHIHGEAKKAETLCLGFKHYTRTAGKMSDLVRFQKFQEKLEKGEPLNSNTWLDLMFTHDIHIVGLALDSCEIDLWWLLTYRAFVYHMNPEIRKHITNTITLYDTSPNASKQSLFGRLLVEYIPVTVVDNNFTAAYEGIADRISVSLA